MPSLYLEQHLFLPKFPHRPEMSANNMFVIHLVGNRTSLPTAFVMVDLLCALVRHQKWSFLIAVVIESLTTVFDSGASMPIDEGSDHVLPLSLEFAP